jgi:hypothetical protein
VILQHSSPARGRNVLEANGDEIGEVGKAHPGSDQQYQFFFVIGSVRFGSLAELCLRSIFTESRRDWLDLAFAFLSFCLPHRLLLYSGLFGLLDGSP